MSLRLRLTRWLIAAAILAVAAWVFESATHLHLADSDDPSSPSTAHLCAYCIGLQVGAGPVAASTHIAHITAERVAPEAAPIFFSFGAVTSYRSRAPPVL